MRTIQVTVGPLATASANKICLSQTPGAAGALTLNGAAVTSGVAVLDTPRRVLFTLAGNETGKTFTLVGTNASGSPQQEVVNGVNATTTYSALDYATVTSITISAAAAGAVQVGTNTIASSPWVRFDEYALSPIRGAAVVTGTVNYTVQTSMDDPNWIVSPPLPEAMTWISSEDTNVVGAIATKYTYFTQVPLWCRVTLNSGSGSVTSQFAQSGVVPT